MTLNHSKTSPSMDTTFQAIHNCFLLLETDSALQECIVLAIDLNQYSNDSIQSSDVQSKSVKIFFLTNCNIQSCAEVIKTAQQLQLIVLTFGAFAAQLLPLIDQLDHVDSVFIVSNDQHKYQHLLYKYTKTVGIYEQPKPLYQAVEQQINHIHKQYSRFSFFNPHQYKKRNLSKSSSDFLWLQLLYHVILHLPHDIKAKQQMIDEYRNYCSQHTQQFNEDQPFQQIYQSTEPIRSYLDNAPLRTMIAHALRTKDTQRLYAFRYFLRDLIESIPRTHQQSADRHQPNHVFYSEHTLSQQELQSLKDNKGNLVCIKQFLIVRRSFPQPRPTMSTSPSWHKPIPVVVRIDCDQQEMNDFTVFSPIARSDNDATPTEALFNLNAVFRLDDIVEYKNTWILTLTAVGNAQSIVQKYVDDTRRQTESLSVPVILGRLLFDMNLFVESRKYFESLLNDSYEEDVARIELCIGENCVMENRLKHARTMFNSALHRMTLNEPIRVKDSADVLSAIGELLYFEGKFDESYSFHVESLAIRRRYCTANDVNIAVSLTNMGMIEQQRGRFDESLVLSRQALEIKERFYGAYHSEVACELINISAIQLERKEFEDALTPLQRVKIIMGKLSEKNEVQSFLTLVAASRALTIQDLCDEASIMFLKVWNSAKRLKRIDPTYQLDTLAALGSFNAILGKHDEAIDLLEQKLALQNKCSPSDLLGIALTLQSIGNVYKTGKEDFSRALEFHTKSLALIKGCYPTFHARIAEGMINIGNDLRGRNEYEMGLQYLKRGLQMQRCCFGMDNMNTARTLSSIGAVLHSQGRLDEAFATYAKVLSIQKKNYKGTHSTIGEALNCLGSIRLEQNKLDEAVELFMKAEAVFKKSALNFRLRFSTLQRIAGVFCKVNDFDKAIEFLEQSIDIPEMLHPSFCLKIIDTLNTIGELKATQWKTGEAITFFLRSVNMYAEYFPENYQEIVKRHMDFGGFLIRNEVFEMASPIVSHALGVLLQHCQNDYHQIGEALLYMVHLSVGLGSFDLALTYMTCLLKMMERNSGLRDKLVFGLSNMAQLQEKRDQQEFSLAYLLQHFLVIEKQLPPDHYEIGNSLFNIGRKYESLHKRKLALKYYHRALLILEQHLPDASESFLTLQLLIQQLSSEDND